MVAMVVLPVRPFPSMHPNYVHSSRPPNTIPAPKKVPRDHGSNTATGWSGHLQAISTVPCMPPRRNCQSHGQRLWNTDVDSVVETSSPPVRRAPCMFPVGAWTGIILASAGTTRCCSRGQARLIVPKDAFGGPTGRVAKKSGELPGVRFKVL